MSLAAYVARRLLLMVPVVLGVTILVFFLIHLVPGDPARTMLGTRATPERVQLLHEQWGLDEPLPVQYQRFMERLVRGDLGTSLFYSVSAGRLVLERLPVTLWLIGLGALFSVLIAVPLAVLAAARRDRPTDHVIRAVPLVGLGFPAFWIGIMLLLAFAVNSGSHFPVGGYGEGFVGHLHSMILPAFTVALGIAPILVRSLRASLLEILESDYIATARSKGLTERRVLVRHALRNGIISMVSVLAVSHRLPRRRHAHRRAGLRPAGHRPADDQRDPAARLPGRPGGGARLRHHGRARLPAGRHRARDARSARPLRLMTTAAETILETAAVEHRRGFRRRWYRTPSFVAGLSILGLITLLGVLAPVITWHDPAHQDLLATFQGPSLDHPLGTDDLGRDVLSRLLHAARTDLQIAFLAVFFPFVLGTAVGLLSGYFGGRADTIANWFVSVVVAFPFYVLIIALVFVLGSGTRNIYIAITLVGWVSYTRIVRGEVLVTKRREYVLAAQTAGLSTVRILRRHILPNVITQAIVFAMSDIVLVILAIVTLGYLGLGVQPPTPDWGRMIADGQPYLTTNWELATIPGLAIVFTALGLSLLADGLADLLRPE